MEMEKEERNTSLSKVEFWSRVAALAFGLWALMIPIGIIAMRDGIKDSSTAYLALADKINTYILQNERRLVLLEDRQRFVLEQLKDYDKRIEEAEKFERQNPQSRIKKE